jgi:hypothetical protein
MIKFQIAEFADLLEDSWPSLVGSITQKLGGEKVTGKEGALRRIQEGVSGSYLLFNHVLSDASISQWRACFTLDVPARCLPYPDYWVLG